MHRLCLIERLPLCNACTNVHCLLLCHISMRGSMVVNKLHTILLQYYGEYVRLHTEIFWFWSESDDVLSDDTLYCSIGVTGVSVAFASVSLTNCYVKGPSTYTPNDTHLFSDSMRSRQAKSIPNTFGHFTHLDTYTEPIATVISNPSYCSPPSFNKDCCLKLALCDNEWEPWPPSPQTFLGSVLASHCHWLASQVPTHAVFAYAREHWNIRKCFPSFGHVHLLYASQPIPTVVYPWAKAHSRAQSSTDDDEYEEGLVYLPAELCVCDCAVKAADEGYECRTGPLALLSQWLCDSGEWCLLPQSSLPIKPIARSGDVVDWTNFLLELYCVAWPMDALNELSDKLRDTSHHSQWLPPVVDAVVSNRDIDPLVVQSAASLILLSPWTPSLIRAVWLCLRCNDQPVGPIADWLSIDQTPTRNIAWEQDRTSSMPAVWRAAVRLFGQLNDANLDPVIRVVIYFSLDGVVLQRIPPSNSGSFVWRDGGILCT
jgi:hypothetical protein